jgi:hypothetical protein
MIAAITDYHHHQQQQYYVLGLKVDQHGPKLNLTNF